MDLLKKYRWNLLICNGNGIFFRFVDFSSDTIWILSDGFLYFHDFYINFLFNGLIERLQNEIPSLERDSWIFCVIQYGFFPSEFFHFHDFYTLMDLLKDYRMKYPHLKENDICFIFVDFFVCYDMDFTTNPPNFLIFSTPSGKYYSSTLKDEKMTHLWCILLFTIYITILLLNLIFLI